MDIHCVILILHIMKKRPLKLPCVILITVLLDSLLVKWPEQKSTKIQKRKITYRIVEPSEVSGTKCIHSRPLGNSAEGKVSITLVLQQL